MGYNSLLNKPDLLAEFLTIAPFTTTTELANRFKISYSCARTYYRRFSIPRKNQMLQPHGVKPRDYPQIIELVEAGASLKEISRKLSLQISSLHFRILKINHNNLGKRIRHLKRIEGLDSTKPIKAQLEAARLWPSGGLSPSPRYSPGSQAHEPSNHSQSSLMKPQDSRNPSSQPPKNTQLTQEIES